MAIKPNRPANVNTGVGEIVAKPRHCCQCDGPWDVPMPARTAGTHHRYGAQKYLPHPNGDGLCWPCWDKLQGRGQVAKTPPQD